MPSTGQVAGLWWNEQSAGSQSASHHLVQMQDMSLHMLSAPSQGSEKGAPAQLLWSREEGLSDVKQVEVVD